MIFTFLRVVKKRLPVLMSRWTMRCSWAYCSPFAIWMPRRATSRGVSFPRLCRMFWSGAPSSSSMVM